MWVVRELLRLVERIAIAFLLALVIAALWALVGKHGFLHDLRLTCLLVGALAILMGAMGRGTPFERRLDYGITERAWGTLPGVSSVQFHPEDPTLTPGAVFFGAGGALLLFGLFVV